MSDQLESEVRALMRQGWDFLKWAERYRAGDPSLHPEEYYIESEELVRRMKATEEALDLQLRGSQRESE